MTEQVVVTMAVNKRGEDVGCNLPTVRHIRITLKRLFAEIYFLVGSR